MKRVHRLFVAAAMQMCSMFVANAQEMEFPYPAVPDSLTQDDQRLEYMLCHFWDNYSFADNSEKNKTVGEQGFVDFLDVLQYADGSLADVAVKKYVEKLVADGSQLDVSEQNMEHYLGYRESPLRNDVIYALFLRHFADALVKSDFARSSKMDFLFRSISKNQVGTVLGNYKLKDSANQTVKLYDVHSPVIVIEIYDPDCYECKLTEAAMAKEPLLHRSDVTLLRLLAEDAEPMFYVPTTPTFYILDSNYRIIKKDITYEQLKACLLKSEEF